MKRNPHTYRPVALVALMAAAALPLTPAFAQEAAPVAAPPVVEAVPAPAAPAAAAAAPERVFAPRQDVVQPTPPRLEPVAEVAEPTAVTPQPRTVARTTRAAPRAATVAPRSAVAPVVSTPAPVSNTPPIEAIEPATPDPLAVAPEPVATEAVVPVTTETPSGTPWLWIAAALAGLVALLGFLFTRRKRSENVGYGSPTYVPVDETGAPVPEVDLDKRPWIRLTLQPTHSASKGGDQTVDYDLIVENEGQVAARDVCVSSFLTGGTGKSVLETMDNSQAQTHHISVEPGETVTVPGTVTVRDGIDPKIVADARYKLPNGSEGHLAARFGIDMTTPDVAQVEDVLERV